MNSFAEMPCRHRAQTTWRPWKDKIDRVLQLVFTGRKIAKGLKVTETKKPSLINLQCVVYEFEGNSCDADYIGYTNRHLHLRIFRYR